MRTMLGFAALSANLQEPAGECEGRRRQNVGWVDPGTCSGRSPTASATTLVASGIDACDVGLRCAQRQPTRAQPANAKADECEGRRGRNVGWVDPGTCSGRSPTDSRVAVEQLAADQHAADFVGAGADF